MKKILICGTRKKGYSQIVEATLLNEFYPQFDIKIIEGCCPDSADAYAENWAKNIGVEIEHYPSTTGNYLKRNIEMVQACDEVIAFWDSFSYGTAHTIAHAYWRKKKVTIVNINPKTFRNAV